MSNLDMNKFVAFLNAKKGGGAAKDSEKKDKPGLPKLRYFKPREGDVNIRWLPYVNEQGIPAFVVYYYDNVQVFGSRRVIAPFQFGAEDPIASYIEQRRSSGRLPSEEFKQIMSISPKASYYIPVLDRDNESEGPFIWELNEKRFKELATVTLAHPDFQDEVITDLKSGRDIQIKGKYGDKHYEGKRVLEWSATLRGKTSPVAKTQEKIDEIMAGIQDPLAYNKQFLKKTEGYENLLSTALSYYQNGKTHTQSAEEGTKRGEAESTSSKSSRDEVENALDSAFEDDDLF